MIGIGILGILGLALFVVAGVFAAEMDSAWMALATVIIGIMVLEYGLGIAIFASFPANILWIFAILILNTAAGGAYTAIWRLARVYPVKQR